MNTIRCSIVEDLLPLYIDGALREETAQAVREHLSACPACRNEYEKLAQTLTLPSAPDLQEEDRRRSRPSPALKRRSLWRCLRLF
ncbi:anti-sigma factor family protein [Evtepia gabavorous]|uniref:anti-sigma factor family protein n=1 Tax=Evtepia gabavorous TaxID=2211183 RepID=UPI003993458F